MTVLDPRTRTIGIRVSEDEYAELERFCTTGGARSISDLARTAIWEFVHRVGRQRSRPNSAERSSKMQMLEQRIERLTVEIASLKSAKDLLVERQTEAVVDSTGK